MRDRFGKIVSFVGGAALVAVFGTLGAGAWRDYRMAGAGCRSRAPRGVARISWAT
ncbi:hypothetical protein [Polyangium jinanense]|uniref:Uncharacterized protein n=1 Tax=Polyangium jinanense TaxID=2829994 RepID=A0A9X3XE16_9BACT|nr:hypothetical protein [Polyangium jinanense]MDC3959263.1 hypothetical protein [Polyangium jinanense]MDC3987645.1 hypothetical protein [Polyangium jinanense]